MGSMSNPAPLPASSQFDTLAGLISLVADQKGAAKIITQLKEETDKHRAAEQAALAATLAAGSAVHDAQLLADSNAAKSAEIAMQRAKLTEDQKAHEEAKAAHASAASLLETRTANAIKEIAVARKAAEQALESAKQKAAQAEIDHQAAAQARVEAEALRDKLKKMAIAMGIN